MIGCGLSVVGIWLIGTVFQTALLYLFLPPRLPFCYCHIVGCWLLVIGYWLLVVGCWYLVS